MNVFDSVLLVPIRLKAHVHDRSDAERIESGEMVGIVGISQMEPLPNFRYRHDSWSSPVIPI